MHVACLCVTYNRPHVLPEAIESFLRQTYQDKELIILDDAGQYAPDACADLPGVRLFSLPSRFLTIGEKRNASCGLALPETELYIGWDDDDICLPWHIESYVAAAQSGGEWIHPRHVWIDKITRLEYKPVKTAFAGAAGFTRRAFVKAGGYPIMQSGQDQGLMRRVAAAGCKVVYPDAPPSYIYRWYTTGPQTKHLSVGGNNAYENRYDEAVSLTHVSRIVPRWSRDFCRLAAEAQGGVHY